jgi:hypothetical protein
MLAGGTVLAALSLLVEPQNLMSNLMARTSSLKNECQTMVQPQATLSREQLTRLLSVPERSAKDQVRQIVQQPYCTLPAVQARAGVTAQREAYPLAFDPQTWLVLLYEGNEYAGYAFNFR